MSVNPNAIYILEQNIKRVNLLFISANPSAIHILEQNLNKVSWYHLSKNTNAISILERNLDKVNWYGLSSNSNATHLLFHFDYVQMKEQCRSFAEELAKYVFHPARLMSLCEKYEFDFDEYIEIVG